MQLPLMLVAYSTLPHTAALLTYVTLSVQQEGDEITGQISVKPNERNPRDLDIVIDYRATGEAAQGAAEVREYRM